MKTRHDNNVYDADESKEFTPKAFVSLGILFIVLFLAALLIVISALRYFPCILLVAVFLSGIWSIYYVIKNYLL